MEGKEEEEQENRRKRKRRRRRRGRGEAEVYGIARVHDIIGEIEANRSVIGSRHVLVGIVIPPNQNDGKKGIRRRSEKLRWKWT